MRTISFVSGHFPFFMVRTKRLEMACLLSLGETILRQYQAMGQLDNRFYQSHIPKQQFDTNTHIDKRIDAASLSGSHNKKSRSDLK